MVSAAEKSAARRPKDRRGCEAPDDARQRREENEPSGWMKRVWNTSGEEYVVGRDARAADVCGSLFKDLRGGDAQSITKVT
jgi:hypothetical protein